jgi:hypothetical protein
VPDESAAGPAERQTADANEPSPNHCDEQRRREIPEEVTA